MKRAIVIGATSGIGKEVALLLAKQGWIVGAAGRRENKLLELQQEIPSVHIKSLDVTSADAPFKINELISEMGGMDLFFLSSGIGKQNAALDETIELQTLETNGVGFTRVITAAYRYFRKQGNGHIAAISSIAGTKGIGTAPSYSATKKFQNTYLQALAQLAYLEKIPIQITDIRPGFVDTALLDEGHYYPMKMKPQKVACSIVKAVNHRRRIKIIDHRYALLVFFWRLFPRCVWEKPRYFLRKLFGF
ncbi:MAG: SDR family NAD(P)-dependent oxidoreductase [Bacteroidales bacterium]|jgi:short-subunit dehydrogenase|nr:SDR family NAD(P)-dependent oxidoreductase [Bacteroidales bacterium]